MSDAYRDEHEAALRHLDALRRENAELRERLANEPARDAAAARASAGRSGLLLIAGMFFLAGSVTVAGAQRTRCTRGMGARGASPCPYLAAHGEGAIDRGERLLRNEPGVVRVELTGASASARVAIDGITVPRSGAIALSGPLAGGAMHVVDVSASGFTSTRTRVWVTPGRTEVVRVTPEPDPLARDDEESPEEPR
jgi:hypothetical protein